MFFIYVLSLSDSDSVSSETHGALRGTKSVHWEQKYSIRLLCHRTQDFVEYKAEAKTLRHNQAVELARAKNPVPQRMND